MVYNRNVKIVSEFKDILQMKETGPTGPAECQERSKNSILCTILSLSGEAPSIRRNRKSIN